jgi:hypothetical protein
MELKYMTEEESNIRNTTNEKIHHWNINFNIIMSFTYRTTKWQITSDINGTDSSQMHYVIVSFHNVTRYYSA